MKNRMRKKILLTGMLCAMSVAAACGGTDTPPAAENRQEDAGNNDLLPEPEEDATNVPAAWSDTSPDLEGDIRELQDGKITVAEAVTEKSADGGEIMVTPEEGADDSEFNKVTVTYDENTLFAVQTIYDGGARAEVSEASAADLAEGQLITVWGTSQGTEWTAAQICIVKVE